MSAASSIARLTAVASGLVVLSLAGEAAASCQPRLQNVAQRVSELPGETDYRLTDRLSELYDEALALEESQPARCLVVVAQMEALLAGRGGAGASTGGAGGDGLRLPGGRATIETRGGDQIAETPVLPVPPLAQRGFEVRGPNPFTQSVVDYWTGSSVWERGRLLAAGNDYIEALRESAEEVIAAEDDDADKRRAAAAASEAIHAVEVYQHVVLVNEPEDMLAARQADALRRLRESSRRALIELTRKELADEERAARERAQAEDDLLAPPVRPSSSAAAADGDDDLLAPPKRRDESFMERIRRRVAEADAFLVEEVRKVAPWIEYRGGFVEP